MAHATSPYISAYSWSGLGFGSKFSNPSILPTGEGNSVAFSPSSDAIAVVHDNSPRITVYPWSNAGFGSKFSDPSTPIPGLALGVAFNPSGTVVAVAHGTSSFISVLPIPLLFLRVLDSV